MATLKILGITNDVDTCECCGRTGLKRTVRLGVVGPDATIETVMYYGSNCAVVATKLRRTGKAIEALAEQAERDAEEAKTRRVVVLTTDPALLALNVTWVVESIGNNGGSVRRLCFAKGLRSEVYRWAEKEFPGAEINVRKMIGGMVR